ncbi:hypothetical protein C8J57DRAFT_1233933 [Mycena rebaudengoi]|nr:hypothetical protein C8J57DRAFT_1233933 [Mycena rebaudengoi]
MCLSSRWALSEFGAFAASICGIQPTFERDFDTPQIFQLHARVVLDNEFIKRDSDIRAHPEQCDLVSPGRIARSRWLRRGGVAGSRILRQRFWRLKNLRLGAAEFARPAAGSSKRGGRGVGKGLLLADWYLNTGSAASGALLLAIAVLQTRGAPSTNVDENAQVRRRRTTRDKIPELHTRGDQAKSYPERRHDVRGNGRVSLRSGRGKNRAGWCMDELARLVDWSFLMTWSRFEGAFECPSPNLDTPDCFATPTLRLPSLQSRPLRHGKYSTTTTTAAPAVRSVAASERATATPPQPRPIHIPYTMMQRSVLVPLRRTVPPRGFFYFKPACTARALAGRARIPLPRSIICDASSLAPLPLATRALRQSGARTLRSRRARSAELCFVSARLSAQWAARALRRKTSRMHAHARETQTGRTGAARSRFAPNHGLARAWRARCSGSQGRRILAARGSAAAGTCSRLRGQRVRTQAPPARLRRVWSRRGAGCEAASRTSNLATARLVEPQTRKARDLAIASMSCVSARALLACPVSSRNCGAACSHTRDRKPGWRARVHPACAVRRRRYPHLESGALSALPASNRRAESLAGSCGQRGCALKCSRIIPVSAARCISWRRHPGVSAGRAYCARTACLARGSLLSMRSELCNGGKWRIFGFESRRVWDGYYQTIILKLRYRAGFPFTRLYFLSLYLKKRRG